MITALKAKESKKVTILRSLISQIKNAEIDKHRELTDEEVVAVIRKQLKSINDAKLMFEKGGRTDLVEENEYEMKVLSSYVPAEMPEDELLSRIKTVIEAHPEVTNMGQKIGLVVRELKGVAESSRIAGLVNKHKA